MKDLKDLADAVFRKNYADFANPLLQEIRKETFGKDIGQNSWLTVDEYLRFLKHLKLNPSSRVLDVACGSGGPTLFIARKFRCQVTGVDVEEAAVKLATESARDQKISRQADFRRVDAGKKLPFQDGLFGGIICIDAIIHLRNRLQVL